MNDMKFMIYLLLMAVVTYLVRALPLVLVKKKFQNTLIQSFLNYIPYAVLAAMTFPVIFYSTGNLFSGVLATAVGLFLAYCERSMVVVAIITCLVAYFIHFFC